MIWAGIISAFASSKAYRLEEQAQSQAHQNNFRAQKLAYQNNSQEQMNALQNIAGMYEIQLGKAKPAKCPNCGSRAFLHHNSRYICAYCRGER